MPGLIRNAIALALPWKRRQMMELDSRYDQARALGMSAEDFNTHVEVMKMRWQLSELEAMDEVLEELRKGKGWAKKRQKTS